MKRFLVALVILANQTAHASFSARGGDTGVITPENAVSQMVLSKETPQGEVAICRIDLNENPELVPHFLTLSKTAQTDLSMIPKCGSEHLALAQDTVPRMMTQAQVALLPHIAAGVVLCTAGAFAGYQYIEAVARAESRAGQAGTIAAGAAVSVTLLSGAEKMALMLGVPAAAAGGFLYVAGACYVGGTLFRLWR